MNNLIKLIAIAFISLAPVLSYAMVSGAVTITQVRPLASWPSETSAKKNEVYFYTIAVLYRLLNFYIPFQFLEIKNLIIKIVKKSSFHLVKFFAFIKVFSQEIFSS